MDELDRVREALDPGYRQEQQNLRRIQAETRRRQAAANERLKTKNLKLTIDRLLPQADQNELSQILEFLIANRGECPTCGTKFHPPEQPISEDGKEEKELSRAPSSEENTGGEDE
jgi:DNA repair exonuclease SbcCD ATPase subunit